MAYNTYTYILLFLTATTAAYFLCPKKRRFCVLLAANIIFYLSAGLRCLPFLLATMLSSFGGGLWLEQLSGQYKQAKKSLDHVSAKAVKKQFQRKKRWAVFFSLALPFALLLFLKYYTFLSNNINAIVRLLAPASGLPALKLFLPLGISFYTLQAASYVIDVYRGKYAAEHNFVRYALYMSFFPTIVEGPIARYDQMADQLYEGHDFDGQRAALGCERILWGLLKKVVIADRANMLVNTVFMPDVSYNGLITAVGILAYTLQIYTEFSGCMDIVAGSAQILGITVPENFRRPYFSLSPAEFWRRWHITLGAWLKDYVFYPLSSCKPLLKLTRRLSHSSHEMLKKLLPSACALFFVWLGNGLWHGPSWRYILYGMYYYVIMMAGMFLEPLFVRLFQILPFDRHGRFMHVFRWARTFFIVNIGMMIFRAASTKTALRMFLALFSGGLASLTDGSLLTLGIDVKDYAVLLIGSVILFSLEALQEKGIRLRETLSAWPTPVRYAALYTMLLTLILFGAYGPGYDPAAFIYAQF